MKSSVIILGGGVAGMSAAHELAERGYKVTVFEKQPELPGGKARSIPVKAFTSPNHKHLPGEHGFRFFPGFYRHIIDTMERIPMTDDADHKKNTADNLVEAPKMMLTRVGKEPIQLPTGFPDGPEDIRLIIDAIFNTDTGLKPGESKVILSKLWQLMTSSRARRFGEYEHIGWWDFCEADL
ncbi:FAD-dependent oxidoreductase [Marinoscillum furvescens]|uniref:Putative NAD(P)-binding protein n=1 Tax=Marinoscillum furvescens DSM 4134 TaxID=1122208 RepID=A0A3D9L2V3_MARFU|nr:FAD-dependent oxidoreductase [Marinoscillum furvescens]RED96981.1 putative NAD(P)-binding protein [Marinoscillum furvescens DSM 4134]